MLHRPIRGRSSSKRTSSQSDAAGLARGGIVMQCVVVRSRRPWLARTLAPASAVMVLLLGSVTPAHAQDHVTVSGIVRDVSGGVVAGATLEALVGERIIARGTTGA